MHRPESRSASIDSPMQPSIPITRGITSSRTFAIPSSMVCGSVRTVLGRAYMPPLLRRAGKPGAPRRTGHPPRPHGPVATGSHAGRRPLVELAAEVVVEHLPEDRLLGDGEGEQRHRRLQLLGI